MNVYSLVQLPVLALVDLDLSCHWGTQSQNNLNPNIKQWTRKMTKFMPTGMISKLFLVVEVSLCLSAIMSSNKPSGSKSIFSFSAYLHSFLRSSSLKLLQC